MFTNLIGSNTTLTQAEGIVRTAIDDCNDQIRTSVGGNADLGPETSVNKTLGVVWSPEFISGFDVSLDWWNIQLSNTVIAYTAQAILDACIYDNNVQACGLYNRKPDGSIDRLLSSSINIGTTDVEGYDLTIGYRLPEQSWGRLSFVLDSTYTSHYELNDDGDDLVGEPEVPAV